MSRKAFASLVSRQIVVTGGSSGIGRAIVREFSSAGADVLLHYAHESRSPDVLQFLAQLQSSGHRAESLRFPFQADTDYEEFVDRCFTAFPDLEIWINNAGVDLLTGDAARLSYSNKLRRLWEVDVQSTIQLTKLVGAKFQAAGRGVIVNIGWDQADRGMEGDSGELFAAAKNAIMGATRSFALSLAPEVRVNCIAPGWIKTSWGEQAGAAWQNRVLRETPLRRWGTPEDIAKLARFLVSDEASYLTGQVINANGGAVR